MRATPHRQRVHEVIATAEGPLSADEVRQRLRSSRIGLATTYRALKAGLEAGTLVAIEFPAGPTRYEPADRPHHHHFSCDGCGRVFDLEGCPGRLEGLLPAGFRMARHSVLLGGTCAECA